MKAPNWCPTVAQFDTKHAVKLGASLVVQVIAMCLMPESPSDNGDWACLWAPALVGGSHRAAEVLGSAKSS